MHNFQIKYTQHNYFFILLIFSVSRRPEDIVAGWRRVQCSVVGGPISSLEEQTASGALYQQQIINHLQNNNFSIPGTEIASRKSTILVMHLVIY